jgi:hypothetical protein
MKNSPEWGMSAKLLRDNNNYKTITLLTVRNSLPSLHFTVRVVLKNVRNSLLTCSLEGPNINRNQNFMKFQKNCNKNNRERDRDTFMIELNSKVCPSS